MSENIYVGGTSREIIDAMLYALQFSGIEKSPGKGWTVRVGTQQPRTFNLLRDALWYRIEVGVPAGEDSLARPSSETQLGEQLSAASGAPVALESKVREVRDILSRRFKDAPRGAFGTIPNNIEVPSHCVRTLLEVLTYAPPSAAGVKLSDLDHIRWWINAYTDPASGPHFHGHGIMVALLREYLALRESLALTAAREQETPSAAGGTCRLCDLPSSDCECCDACGEPPRHCECTGEARTVNRSAAGVSDLVPLARLGAWTLERIRGDHAGDVDAWAVQDEAVKLGVIGPVPAPKPCGPCCVCEEMDADTCYRDTEATTRARVALTAAHSPESPSAAGVKALDEWCVVTKDGRIVNAIRYTVEGSAYADCHGYDCDFPVDAPHRVMRVCLREEPAAREVQS